MEFREGISLKRTAIGKIPKDWQVVRLGNPGVAEIRGGRAIKHSDRVAFIPMELVPDQGIYCEYEVRNIDQVKSATYCEVGDLLLAKITPSLENGKQGIVPSGIPGGFAFATTEVFPIVCKGIDINYLFYVLKFPKYRNKLIGSMIGTTGRQRASKSAVDKLEIPLPDPKEQEKIAEILSTVDEGIGKVDQAIHKTERLKKGLMQDLLTKGIGHKEFKDTEIGRIPIGWDVKRLSKVGRILTGKTPPTAEGVYWNGDVPFITPADMSNEKYVHETERHITRRGAQLAGETLRKNAVLVVCIGSTIGKTGMTSIESTTNQQINAIICNDENDPEYVYYAVSFRSDLIRSFSGVAAVPIIKKSLLERFKIPGPRLMYEQRRIAEILGVVDRRLELLRGRRERLERIKKGLMNDLLTGKRRVKV